MSIPVKKACRKRRGREVPHWEIQMQCARVYEILAGVSPFMCGWFYGGCMGLLMRQLSRDLRIENLDLFANYRKRTSRAARGVGAPSDILFTPVRFRKHVLL
ncbi:AIS_HP2_G0018940.mRNA.1.CDS.1 [Saccharomyces cerevisiae]|nr:AIS_HP2_G0018940.mRNA.1.CDS.1 [Saccharomyces cerevisiae]CAI6513755.1 AIS_HP2_G0018940.mRNA.1.CDS.1 [Saccharomyces cerevisiae]